MFEEFPELDSSIALRDAPSLADIQKLHGILSLCP